MKKHLFTLFLSLSFLGLQAQYLPIFLKYDGINGDVAVTRFRDHVEIFDLSYNVATNILSNSTETTPIVKQPSSPGLITFYNVINKSTPATSNKFYTGALIAKIEIKLTKGIDEPIYCVLTLEECKIASIQNFGDNQEKIQILATKFKVTYTPYNNIGQAQTPVTRGWDYVTNLQNN